MLPKTSKTIALCSLANFINAADRIVMPIAIIPMTDHYNWSLYWQGWILSAFAFGYITSQVRSLFYDILKIIFDMKIYMMLPIFLFIDF